MFPIAETTDENVGTHLKVMLVDACTIFILTIKKYSGYLRSLFEKLGFWNARKKCDTQVNNYVEQWKYYKEMYWYLNS